MNNSIVYKVMDADNLYIRFLDPKNPVNSVWTTHKEEAHKFAYSRAHAIWKKLRAGLDDPSKNPYGFGVA